MSVNNVDKAFYPFLHREIQHDYQQADTLPATHLPFPECMCNYTEPLLTVGEPLYCGQLPFSHTQTVAPDRLRIGELRQGYSRPEYVVVGDQNAGWMSSGGTDVVHLIIHLRGEAQVMLSLFLSVFSHTHSLSLSLSLCLSLSSLSLSSLLALSLFSSLSVSLFSFISLALSPRCEMAL